LTADPYIADPLLAATLKSVAVDIIDPRLRAPLCKPEEPQRWIAEAKVVT
jgi:hypothetical protein